jgi:hypothetical protein
MVELVYWDLFLLLWLAESSRRDEFSDYTAYKKVAILVFFFSLAHCEVQEQRGFSFFPGLRSSRYFSFNKKKLYQGLDLWTPRTAKSQIFINYNVNLR